MELTREEVSNWKADPTTKKVFASLAFMVEDCKEMLVDGVQDYGWARGFISGMRVVFNIEGGKEDDGDSES
ncbi:MAG: hypothetical protein ACXAEN_26805 [Candidatus Thorarchaeota archaeon]